MESSGQSPPGMITPKTPTLQAPPNPNAPSLTPLLIPEENVELRSLEYGTTEHSKSGNALPSTPFIRSPDAYHHHPKHVPSALRAIWVVVALPVISWAYLIFCFVVDHKAVTISLWRMDTSVSHLNVIKAGVTSLSILTITIPLLPLKSLLGDLQGEEFFRVLTLKRGGVPLSTINQVSTSSYGFIDKMSAIVRRQSSGVFAGAFVAGLVAVVASTLAPATLSVQVVQFDEDLRAFRVGAVYRQSVWNSTEEGVFTLQNVTERTSFAAVLPWVETNLKVNYNWESPDDADDGSMFAVPTPLDLPVHATARYLTDIITYKPSCKWHKPDLSNLSDSLNRTANQSYGYIPDLGWQISIYAGDLTTSDSTFKLYDLSPGTGLADSKVKDANGNSLIDGSSLWHISKCIPGAGKCKVETNPPWVRVGNLVINDIPTTTFTTSDGKNFAVSFLVCRPNESVETKEIKTSPEGKITVVQSETVFSRQNNINRQQARVLMSQALLGLADGLRYSGPNPHVDVDMLSLGGAAQLQMLFGNEVASKTPSDLQFVVRPIQDLSKSYGKSLQSTLKLFLDGTLAQGYVPGRTIKDVLIFTTSRPHLYVSAVIFAILTFFVIAVHFRTPVPQFTFFSVASSLSRSDVPSVFEDIKHRDGDHIPERVALRELRNRDIALEGYPGLSPTAIRLR